MFSKVLSKIRYRTEPTTSTLPDAKKESGLGQGIALKLKFHEAHGKDVTLHGKSQIAIRDEECFQHGVLFSHRSIGINESVAVQVTATSSEFCGPLKIGFTTINPRTFIDEETTKSVVPTGSELQLMHGVWMKPILALPIELGSTVYWKVTNDGSLLYGVDGLQGGVLLRDVNTSQRLWAVVEVYGKVQAVQFVNKTMTLCYQHHDTYYNPRLIPKSYTKSKSVNFADVPLFSRRNVKLSPLPGLNENFIWRSMLKSPMTPQTPAQFFSPMPFNRILNGLCILCTDKAKTTAFADCGHICMCYLCAVSYSTNWTSTTRNNCPVCNNQITSIFRVFK